jgi:UDP-N-acetylmuramate dehydrogenase
MEEGRLVTSTCFCLDRDTPEAVSEKMGGFLKTRKQTQPLEYPSAGSVFKNPPGAPFSTPGAGRLIEKAGLKGKRIGGAMVSEKHANFIVNKGGATAGDILMLMDLVRLEVKRMSGIDLEPEIRILGK